MNAHANPAPVIAIVGATGAVGIELIRCLENRDFPVGQLRLLASARSAGRELPFRSQPVVVEELTEASFAGVDVAFFSAGATISRKFAPIAAAAGAQVIDNSSAFRMDDDIPLVVPEANAHALRDARIIANPNCIAAILTVALAPLHQRWSITRLAMSTYQAASGGGIEMMEELREGTRAYLDRGLSVRELEALVTSRRSITAEQKRRPAPEKDPRCCRLRASTRKQTRAGGRHQATSQGRSVDHPLLE